ncbi:MAG TPA: prepilin peptidase [Candidatus Baltobacteraceae bacterium]|jgi:leader peptidase (prepilin peptidase)/N-methyltransferase|nr:prepilin peptidase [Candidatus Baltobacteraceae bacterium]
MIATVLNAIASAVFFGTAGLAGILLGNAFCERFLPLEDAPPAVKVPPAALVIASAAIGVALAVRGADQLQLLAIAVTCIALTGIWVTDARRGIVPDAFTLGALAVLCLAGAAQHQWTPLLGALVTAMPFALMAALSRGRGLGWGDVKLAALGGAALGFEVAVLAFILASFAAAAIMFAQGRKGQAIAFAPYLASAIGLALPLGFRV